MIQYHLKIYIVKIFISTPENIVHQKCTVLTLTELKELITNKKLI